MARRIGGETAARAFGQWSSKGTYQVCRLKENAQTCSRLRRWRRAIKSSTTFHSGSLQRRKLLHSRSRHAHVDDAPGIVTEDLVIEVILVHRAKSSGGGYNRNCREWAPIVRRNRS